LLDRPAVLVWFLGVTLIAGLALLGHDGFLHVVFLSVLLLFLVALMLLPHSRAGKIVMPATFLVAALLADQHLKPPEHEFMTPLDEGMTMDMPITVPRASVTQSGDDLKARDMMFCRFPEVDMVVGKAGRAETPTDPAPIDMIETMVNFRPPEFWPRRKLKSADAERQGRQVLDRLVECGLIDMPERALKAALVNEAAMASIPVFDALMREFCYQRNQQFQRDLGRKLVRVAIERMVAMLKDSGVLRRETTASDVTLLADPFPTQLA